MIQLIRRRRPVHEGDCEGRTRPHQSVRRHPFERSVQRGLASHLGVKHLCRIVSHLLARVADNALFQDEVGIKALFARGYNAGRRAGWGGGWRWTEGELLSSVHAR